MDTTMTFHPWSNEEIEKVEKLVKEGHSSSSIASILGNRSRNSVIGMMHRRGIGFAFQRRTPSEPRAVKERRTPEKRVKINRIFVADKKPEAPKHVDAQEPDTKYRVKFLDRRSNQCKFIVEKKGDTYYCCGGPIDRNGWCAYHAAIVYRPIDPKPINRDGNGIHPALRRPAK